MDYQDTKDRILDAGERLFAQRGFHTTSLRAVTSEAKVNLAAVNYHFGSKNTLLDAIMERRIKPLNEKRLQMLRQVLEKEDSLTVRNIIYCFIKPTLDLLNQGPQRRYFVMLIGRVLAEQSGPQREIFHRHMLPVLPPFFQAFSKLKPHLSTKTIAWGMHFAIGAISHSIRMFCNPQINTDHEMAIEFAELEEMLVEFIASGQEKTYA